LVALMIMVTVILISLTEALPDIAQNVRREREQAAMFRGEQYARAIYLFHRTLGRYPNSVKELLDTNGTRFLREAYPDPLSPNGRWHFIHASASGVILDSQNQTVSPTSQPGGTSSPPGSQGQTNANTSGFGSSQANTNSSAFGSSAQTNGSPSGFGSGTGFGSSSGFSSSPGFGSSTQTGQSSTTNGTKKKAPPKLAPDCKGSEDFDSSSSAQSGELLGATIVGVAPCNLKASIQVLAKKDHYYEWEFLGMNYVPYTLPQVQVVKPSSFGNSQPGQAQPFSSTPNSPSSGTQTSPPQSNQTQNPF